MEHCVGVDLKYIIQHRLVSTSSPERATQTDYTRLSAPPARYIQRSIRSHKPIPTITSTTSAYESDTDSHSGDPALLGLTGDACGSCKSTEVPLYDLSCHDSDDFYCRDCLTKTWYNAQDEVVHCPSCSKDCDFMPVKDIEEFRGISRNFHQDEAFDKIRQQPKIMNNLIGFTAREAAVFLQHAYSHVEDQILDPVELGGLPSSYIQSTVNTAIESFATNPFFGHLVQQVTAVPKMMTAPLQLEEDLLKELNHIIIDLAKQRFGNQIADWNDEAVLEQVLVGDEQAKSVRENWIIKIWVDLLAWRHIERTAPAEGGAAERRRAPIDL